MQNPANGPQRAAPWRIEDLAVAIASVQHILAQQEIQMMMAVLVNQIIDQIEIITPRQGG